MTSPDKKLDNTIPTDEEATVAKASSKTLASLPKDQPYYSIKVMKGTQGETISIPADALDFLVEILAIMGQGHTVKLTAIPKELDIYQAADILGVSNDYVWKLQDTGKIPYQIIRNLRKMRYEDVIKYKNRSLEESMKALDELSNQAQELNLGY
ncbi:MAG: helix-turn-helix domain-containing protein [Nostocaceae cyanobacterium]|nr:helix-turn-helix domain-containing protein [Nostocaceae cyanobacterium]